MISTTASDGRAATAESKACCSETFGYGSGIKSYWTVASLGIGLSSLSGFSSTSFFFLSSYLVDPNPPCFATSAHTASYSIIYYS